MTELNEWRDYYISDNARFNERCCWMWSLILTTTGGCSLFSYIVKWMKQIIVYINEMQFSFNLFWRICSTELQFATKLKSRLYQTFIFNKRIVTRQDWQKSNCFSKRVETKKPTEKYFVEYDKFCKHKNNLHK